MFNFDFSNITELPGRFLDMFTKAWNMIKGALTSFIAFNEEVNQFHDTFEDFVFHNRLSPSGDYGNFIYLDQLIGNFRFMTGELVFKEIYFLLMLLGGIIIFNFIFKIINLVQGILKKAFNTNIFDIVGNNNAAKELWKKIVAIFT